MNTYSTIRYQRTEHVGTLTLARPEKRNALNPTMLHELAQLGDELLADDTLRCLVVAGDGPSFCAGLDLVEGLAGMLAELAESTAGDDEALERGIALASTFRWIPRLPCPSVAAVQGHALGGGLQLALACDFRIFAENTSVGMTETRYGIFPDMGGTVRLPRIVGEARARELILLGDVIDAAEARAIGLANKVVEGGDLQTAASALASRLAEQPPLALRGARRAIDAAWHLDPDESFSVGITEQIHCLASDDFAEARRAATEGRTPRWRGR